MSLIGNHQKNGLLTPYLVRSVKMIVSRTFRPEVATIRCRFDSIDTIL